MFGGLLCGIGMASAAFCTSIMQLYICVGFITGKNKASPFHVHLRFTSGGLGCSHMGTAAEHNGKWDKKRVGQGPSLTKCSRWTLAKSTSPAKCCAPEHRVPDHSSGSALCRWVLSAGGDGEDGHHCSQLLLKWMQVGCVLPWAWRALRERSVTRKKAPVFLYYSVLSSLYEIQEMRVQVFACALPTCEVIWK